MWNDVIFAIELVEHGYLTRLSRTKFQLTTSGAAMIGRDSGSIGADSRADDGNAVPFGQAVAD